MEDLPSAFLDWLEAREQEASRIGRVLHDEIGQLLTAAGLHLDAARRSQESGQLQQRLDEAQRAFEQAADAVRKLTGSLPGSALERIGLPAALERLIGQYRNRSGKRIAFRADSGLRVTPRASLAFFRIADYALDQAACQPGTSWIEITLGQTKGGVSLEIRVDGPGFEASGDRDARTGLGLLLMERSAQRANLNFRVHSKPGAGTIVTILDPDPGRNSCSTDAANESGDRR